MHKVLQSIIDTFLLAVGSVEFSNTTAHSPSPASQDMQRRSATRSSPDRTQTAERANRAELQPFASKQALQTRAEESRP